MIRVATLLFIILTTTNLTTRTMKNTLQKINPLNGKWLLFTCKQHELQGDPPLQTTVSFQDQYETEYLLKEYSNGEKIEVGKKEKNKPFYQNDTSKTNLSILKTALNYFKKNIKQQTQAKLLFIKNSWFQVEPALFKCKRKNKNKKPKTKVQMPYLKGITYKLTTNNENEFLSTTKKLNPNASFSSNLTENEMDVIKILRRVRDKFDKLSPDKTRATFILTPDGPVEEETLKQKNKLKKQTEKTEEVVTIKEKEPQAKNIPQKQSMKKETSTRRFLKFKCSRLNKSETEVISIVDGKKTCSISGYGQNEKTKEYLPQQKVWKKCEVEDNSFLTENYGNLKAAQTFLEETNKEQQDFMYDPKYDLWLSENMSQEPLEFKCLRSSEIKIKHQDKTITLYSPIEKQDEQSEESNLSYQMYLSLTAIGEEFKKLNKDKATLIYTKEDGLKETEKSLQEKS